jgi:catechol 2,3-dioxygenase-like lactoylglutathione lyase family enzyme
VAARTIGWRWAGLAPPIPAQFVLYVRDMGRAIAFYRDLMGLEVVSEDATFSVLGTGGASIGLHHTSSPEPHATPNASRSRPSPSSSRPVSGSPNFSIPTATASR